MAKKGKGKMIFVAVLSTVLALGVAGTLTAGFLTNWQFKEDNPFEGVSVESKEFVYDGAAKTLDIKVPEGATYTVEIKKDDQVVSECKEIGDYVYTVKVTIGDTTKEYKATLKIVEPKNNVQSTIKADGIQMALAAVEERANGDVAKTFTYTITPASATNQNVAVSVAWAEDGSSSTDNDSFKSGKTVTDYVTASVDLASKTVTVTNVGGKAFGSQIIVKLVAESNSQATASVKVDYQGKITGYRYEINQAAFSAAKDYFTFAENKIFIKATILNSKLLSEGSETLNFDLTQAIKFYNVYTDSTLAVDNSPATSYKYNDSGIYNVIKGDDDAEVDYLTDSFLNENRIGVDLESGANSGNYLRLDTSFADYNRSTKYFYTNGQNNYVWKVSATMQDGNASPEVLIYLTSDEINVTDITPSGNIIF